MNYERKAFKLLSIGDKFDFITHGKPTETSFFAIFEKTSARKYVDENGKHRRIGSINCPVNAQI